MYSALIKWPCCSDCQALMCSHQVVRHLPPLAEFTSNSQGTDALELKYAADGLRRWLHRLPGRVVSPPYHIQSEQSILGAVLAE